MSQLNYKYEEQMEVAEASFLQEKATKERSMLIRVIRTLSVIFVIIPCCIGIIFESLRRADLTPAFKEIADRDDPYFARNYLIAMAVMLLLVAVLGFIYYYRNLWKLNKDLKRNLKSVEEVIINRKQHIESNNSYHFYIDSPIRLSVEVSKEDFEQHDEGDEINIEYSTYSRVYFGYF